jgi:hypothetical protein
LAPKRRDGTLGLEKIIRLIGMDEKKLGNEFKSNSKATRQSNFH